MPLFQWLELLCALPGDFGLDFKETTAPPKLVMFLLKRISQRNIIEMINCPLGLTTCIYSTRPDHEGTAVQQIFKFILLHLLLKTPILSMAMFGFQSYNYSDLLLSQVKSNKVQIWSEGWSKIEFNICVQNIRKMFCTQTQLVRLDYYCFSLPVLQFKDFGTISCSWGNITMVSLPFLQPLLINCLVLFVQLLSYFWPLITKIITNCWGDSWVFLSISENKKCWSEYF